MPEGNAVGWVEGAAGDKIRTVIRQDFDSIGGNLLDQSTEVAGASFPGRWFNLSNGAVPWGMRWSETNGITLQLKVNGVIFEKLHVYQPKSDLIPR